MKVAFVIWNPFQLLQFEAIAKEFNQPTVFIIDKDSNVKSFPNELITSKHWKVEYIRPNDIPLIDGTHDAILFQSAFPNIERLNRSRLVSVQYGLAKERHNYGEWRALADLNLMYGRYSADIVSHFGPSFSIGNPKFDAWPKYQALSKQAAQSQLKLDPDKKTLLYMPTWGELGSYFELLNEFSALQEKFNVILKMHHNNDAKVPEWTESARAANLAHVYDGAADQLLLIAASDLIISDFSGAIFDGMYARKPILLYQSATESKIGIQKFDLTSLEFSKRDEIGYTCDNINNFRDAIDYCLSNSEALITKAEALRKILFHDNTDQSAAKLAFELIRLLVNGQIKPLSQAQVYVRETVKSLRILQPRYNRIEKRLKAQALPFRKKMINTIKKLVTART